MIIEELDYGSNILNTPITTHKSSSSVKRGENTFHARKTVSCWTIKVKVDYFNEQYEWPNIRMTRITLAIVSPRVFLFYNQQMFVLYDKVVFVIPQGGCPEKHQNNYPPRNTFFNKQHVYSVIFVNTTNDG